MLRSRFYLQSLKMDRVGDANCRVSVLDAGAKFVTMCTNVLVNGQLLDSVSLHVYYK